MGRYVAIYDACVLYQAPIRDLLIRLAGTDLFSARWTDEIHDEWVSSLRRDRPDIPVERLVRVRSLMNKAVPDCLVTGYDGLADTAVLPDAKDRHVLAAAVRCQAGVIVTLNLKDFPKDALDPFGIEAQHPDEFVSYLFDLHPGPVCAAVKAQRLALKNPAMNVDEFLDSLLAQGLASTVASLRQMQNVL